MWSEDNYDDYEEVINNKKNYSSNKKGPNKKVIGILIILFIFVLVLFTVNNNSNNYNKYENSLIETAKEFVESRGVTSSREYYIDNGLLNANIGNCSNFSGVFVNGDSYTPYLVCDNYKSDIIDNKNYQLNGEEVTIIPRGVGYRDLGVIGYNAKSIGTVGTIEGVYNIAYNIDNNVLYRKVVVLDSDDLLSLYPQLLLNGDSTLVLYQGSEYEELGCNSFDNLDGTLTNNVIKTSNVDINNVGDYEVNYSITNSRGYTNIVTRRVRVVEKENTVITVIKNDDKTSTDLSINIIISGTNFYSMDIYNNNMFFTSTTESNYVLNLKDNCDITIKAYDKDGTVTEESFKVENFDRSSPKGSCVAVLTDTELTVNVYATSNNSISGYDYIIDDYDSNYRNVTTFTRQVKKVDRVKVNVKDKLGNIGIIECTITDKSKGFLLSFTGRNKHLNENIVTALQRKGHTVGDLNSCITNKVKEYGAGTRKGVAAAGVALIECTYNMTGHTIPYNHTSGNLTYCPKAVVNDLCGKLGINTYWGTLGGTCRDGDSQCYHGLNCGSFVRWAFCNGGMDHCNSVSNGEGFNSSNFFPEMYGFEYYEGKIKSRGTKDVTQGKTVTQLVSMLKPGDIISWVKPKQSGPTSAHVMLVIGNDGQYIYYAEDGDNFIKKSISSYSGFNTEIKYKFSFLDDYYANQSHKNKLY